MAIGRRERPSSVGAPGPPGADGGGPVTKPTPLVPGGDVPPVGPGAAPVGPGAAPVGPGAAPVGPGAAPVGPARRPTRRQTLRYRLIPRTVLGVATLLLAASIGAAFSGAVLYSYYDYRLQKTNDKVNALVGNYRRQFNNAAGDLAAQAAADKAQIDRELGPLSQLQASSATLQALLKKVTPSLFFVHTLDASGQPSVGTAFAIESDPTKTLLVTSYTTIAAATRKPGPGVFVRKGNGGDISVPVYGWDPRFDLALIILPQGNVPVLPAAPATPAPQIGDRVFDVSGLGSLGGAAAQGTITDVDASGVQHTAPVGAAFQGGPLVNPQGQVVAVASRTYAPLNFQSDGVWFAPYIRSACDKVLSCPNGTLGAPGKPAG